MLTKAAVEDKTLFSSQSLIEQLKTYINTLSNVANSDALLKCIQTNFVSFSKHYVTLGDQEFKRIEKQLDEKDNAVYMLHFAIPEIFKDFVLLHRDTLLQLQIAKYKLVENAVTNATAQTHFEASKTVLSDAAHAVLEVITSEQQAINGSKKQSKKLLNSIKHCNNPWEVYAAQFKLVIEQTTSISRNTTLLSRTQRVFEDVKIQNTRFLNDLVARVEHYKKSLGEAIKTIKSLKDPEAISEVVLWIDNTLKLVTKDGSLQDLYASAIESKLNTLSELSIAVSTENGLLLTKKVDFNKLAKKWYDFEVLPDLIDLWENKNNMTSYFKHNLLNLKSGLLVEKNNKSLDGLSSQLQTLQNVHSTLTTNGVKIEKMAASIAQKFNEEFRFSAVYSNQDFLEVSLQSSLNQFASGQTNVFSSLKNKIKRRFLSFNSKYERSKIFSKKNAVENTIDTISYRMIKEDNAHYDSLFLNKNFIGDLFLLPREQQEAALVRSKNQWKNGFNKAVLVSGDALSGKTTFIDYVAEKYFGKNLIHVKRDAVLTFGGRKFTSTKDLQAVLQHIKKGFGNTKVLIIIEDLELWRDANNSLLDTVRSLLSFVASESDNAFILVSTSQQMQSHLDRRVRFSEAFSASIDLSKSTYKEIYNAVMIRHGASHKTLVSIEKEPLTTKQIDQSILKLARKLDYNMGEVLQAWAYSTTMIEDNQVVYQDRDLGITDFFNTEELIILKYIFLYKNITEIELKNYVGSVYENGYKSGLKRLIHVKILLRDDYGLLTLNPIVTMDIKKILIYRGILN